MTTGNSSPEKWRLGPHTQTKHDILLEYLKRFMAVLSGGSRYVEPRTLHYVDSWCVEGEF